MTNKRENASRWTITQITHLLLTNEGIKVIAEDNAAAYPLCLRLEHNSVFVGFHRIRVDVHLAADVEFDIQRLADVLDYLRPAL
jgi:hypothetical protein